VVNHLLGTKNQPLTVATVKERRLWLLILPLVNSTILKKGRFTIAYDEWLTKRGSSTEKHAHHPTGSILRHNRCSNPAHPGVLHETFLAMTRNWAERCWFYTNSRSPTEAALSRSAGIDYIHAFLPIDRIVSKSEDLSWKYGCCCIS
jgi:hypothetical protein